MTAPCGEKKCHRHPKLPWLVCFCMCETKSSHQIIETVASTRGRHLVLFPHCPHLAFFSKMFCIFSFTCYNICYNGRSLNYLACSTMNSLWYLSTFASLLPLWHCFFPSRLLSSPLWLLQCGSSVWGPNELPDCFRQQTPLLILKPSLNQTNTSSSQGCFSLLAVLLMKSLRVRLSHLKL